MRHQSSVLAFICGDAGEQPAQLRSLGLVQRIEQSTLSLVAGTEGSLQRASACFGERNDVPATIGRIGHTGHETLCFEAIEQSNHGRAVDLKPLGRLLLRFWFSSLQQQQHRQLAAADPQRVQVLAVEVLEIDERPLQQVGQPPAEPWPEVSLSCHS